MSLFTMITKKPVVKVRSFHITPEGAKLIREHNKSDDNLAASILAVLNGSRQSTLSLQRITGATPERLGRLLKKMLSRGLVAPVRRE